MRNTNSPRDISRFITVNERFSNASGRETQHGLINQQEFQHGAVGDVEAVMAQQQAAALPISLTVANSTNTNLIAVLFGGAANITATNAGNPTGVTVASANSNISYQQIIQQTMVSPFECSFVRIVDTANTSQCQQLWTVSSVNYAGQLVSTPITNNSYISPMQYQLGIVDLMFPIKIDGLTNCQFTSLANGGSGTNTATIYFFPKTVISPITTLVKGSPTTSFGTPIVPTVFSGGR